MCWNGYDPPRDEDQWEESDEPLPFETSGDLPFTEDADDWRHGHPMGPEEKAFRDLLEDDEGDSA
jgi:hypothetical protein